MFKILQYSLGYTFRKKSTPIFLALIFLFSIAIPMSIYMSAEQLNYRYVKSEIFFNGALGTVLIPIFVLIISYIAIVVGQIFKRGEEDGTTLMLVSSKYTRSQVIVGRFCAILVHVLLVAVIFSVAFEMASEFKNPSAMSYELLAFLSMLIGGFFVCLLFAGLSLVFSILMGRIGAIIVSIFMFVVIAITSPIVMLLTSNSKYGMENFSTVSGYTDRRFYVYDNKDTTGIETQEVLYSPTQSGNGKFTLDDYANSSYNSLAWIDIWTQLSQLLGMFNKDNPIPNQLDKITPVDLTNSYFYSKSLPIVDGTSEKTEEHPDAKMVFDLLKMFKRMVAFDTYSVTYGLTQQEVVKLQDNFELLQTKIKDAQFTADVKNYEKIVQVLNKVEFDTDNGKIAQANGLVDNLASLVNILWNNQTLFNKIQANPTDYSLHGNSPQLINGGYKYDSQPIMHLYENGVELNTVSTADYINGNTSKNEALNDVDAVAKRMAIYFAIYNIEKEKVSADVIANKGWTIPSAANKPIEDMIATDQYFKNCFQFENKPYQGTLDLEQFGKTFTSSPIIPLAFIGVFWPAFALGLFGLAFFLHKRADFK